MQIRAGVLLNSDQCNKIKNTSDLTEFMAMCAAAYNGGLGGLNSDRLSCKATKGCDDSKWFGHVEHTSLKSKVDIPGYGKQSPFSINRTYAYNVVKIRLVRYISIDPKQCTKK